MRLATVNWSARRCQIFRRRLSARTCGAVPAITGDRCICLHNSICRRLAKSIKTLETAGFMRFCLQNLVPRGLTRIGEHLLQITNHAVDHICTVRRRAPCRDAHGQKISASAGASGRQNAQTCPLCRKIAAARVNRDNGEYVNSGVYTSLWFFKAAT